MYNLVLVGHTRHDTRQSHIEKFCNTANFNSIKPPFNWIIQSYIKIN